MNMSDREWAWFTGPDTGASSVTMFCALTARPMPAHTWSRGDVPYDIYDFGRCYRMLKAFPEWRGDLAAVARRFPSWGPLVREWERLSALYESLSGVAMIETAAVRRAFDTFAEQLRPLIDEGRIADGWVQTGPGSWHRPNKPEIKNPAPVNGEDMDD